MNGIATTTMAVRETSVGSAAIHGFSKASNAAIPGLLTFVASDVRAASTDAPEWIQWAVLGAIALLVIGVALRMIIAARFPKGYGAWARSRREEFAERNARWDAGDDNSAPR